MLKAFTRKKDGKANVAETHLDKGLILLRGKLYKQAIIELNLAVDEDKTVTGERLSGMFIESKKIGSWEEALTLGTVLLKIKPSDFELANTVGNIARRLRNYKQANNFYRQSLRANKTYAKAFYNLAASLGQLDVFDWDVKKLIDQFVSLPDFILPAYLNDQTAVADLTAEWSSRQKEEPENWDGARERIYAKLREAIKENWKQQSLADGRVMLQGDIYNMGLFALSQKDGELALEQFFKLSKQQCRSEHLGMLKALALGLVNKTDDAIQEMVQFLIQNKGNRYANVNLGLLYQKKRNTLLSAKFFAITGVLLENSNGEYGRKEILETADIAFDQGDFRQALRLYQLVASEIESTHALGQIGEILMIEKKFQEATDVYRKIKKIDPESKIARDKLHEIHDRYFEKGEDLIANKKVAQGLILYERALSIERNPVTLERTAKIYFRLKDNEKATALLNEHEKILKAARKQEMERKRMKLIQAGKKYVKKKEFAKAINNLEDALTIKMDKDTFVYLAHIYKSLKRKTALSNLVQRWQHKVDIDEMRLHQELAKEKALKSEEKRLEEQQQKSDSISKKLNAPPETSIPFPTDP